MILNAESQLERDQSDQESLSHAFPTGVPGVRSLPIIHRLATITEIHAGKPRLEAFVSVTESH